MTVKFVQRAKLILILSAVILTGIGSMSQANYITFLGVLSAVGFGMLHLMRPKLSSMKPTNEWTEYYPDVHQTHLQRISNEANYRHERINKLITDGWDPNVAKTLVDADREAQLIDSCTKMVTGDQD